MTTLSTRRRPHRVRQSSIDDARANLTNIAQELRDRDLSSAEVREELAERLERAARLLR